MTEARELRQHSDVIPELITQINELSIDRTSVSQELLDLANKERTSLFQWRGQFSPELIELLLKRYGQPDSVVLDPFVGSGTTLFEAARLGFECVGVEINPAAFEMARTVEFVNVPPEERQKRITEAKALLDEYLMEGYDWESFTSHDKPSSETIKTLLRKSSSDPLVHNIVINTIFRRSLTRTKQQVGVNDSFETHRSIVEGLPFSDKPCNVFLEDARKLPLGPGSVGLVVTSPPYINVFNYHQNYRPIMELEGWNLLGVAKSEIGSNRRNRGNRFLTVIEYAIDMLAALQEMTRVLTPQGRIIIVIGRQSSVRGVQFENYKIISALALGGAGLELVQRQERRFINRFGEAIVEDILHFVPGKRVMRNAEGFGRVVGKYFLTQALKSLPEGDVRNEIEGAISSFYSAFPALLFRGKTDSRLLMEKL